MSIVFNEPINWLSAIGLASDCVGVLLLFKYGLPSAIILDVTLLDVGNSDTKKSEAIAKHNKKVLYRAYLGLTLVVIGFLLQLLGVFFKTT